MQAADKDVTEEYWEIRDLLSAAVGHWVRIWFREDLGFRISYADEDPRHDDGFRVWFEGEYSETYDPWQDSAALSAWRYMQAWGRWLGQRYPSGRTLEEAFAVARVSTARMLEEPPPPRGWRSINPKTMAQLIAQRGDEEL